MHIQDIKAVQSNLGQYDFEIDSETRDIATIKGFESVVSVQLDTDQRASRDERSDAQNRQGWIGDIYNEDYRIGSKIHLKQQARDTTLDKNEIAAEAKTSLEYLVKIGAAKEITSAFLGNTIDGKIIVDANNVNRYNRLWRSTGEVKPLPALKAPVSVQLTYVDDDFDFYVDDDGNEYVNEYIFEG